MRSRVHSKICGNKNILPSDAASPPTPGAVAFRCIASVGRKGNLRFLCPIRLLPHDGEAVASVLTQDERAFSYGEGNMPSDSGVGFNLPEPRMITVPRRPKILLVARGVVAGLRVHVKSRKALRGTQLYLVLPPAPVVCFVARPISQNILVAQLPANL